MPDKVSRTTLSCHSEPEPCGGEESLVTTRPFASAQGDTKANAGLNLVCFHLSVSARSKLDSYSRGGAYRKLTD
jgi:hypothetical protein